MVNYKVRSFFEKDTGTAGADVIIYSDEGDVIDTLLITTESTYNDLAQQLEGIDEKYLDRQDLLKILQNTSEEIVEINATYLNGHSSDYYARNNHNHNTVYAPLSHVDAKSSESVLGHAKIINNVSRGSFVNGEALSAYQGKLLSDRIDNAVSDSGWIDLPVNTANGFVNYSDSQKVQYRKIGKVVQIRGAVKTKWKMMSDSIGWSIIKTPLPEGFKPNRELNQLNQGSGKNTHLVRVTSDGNVCVGARYGVSSTIDIPKDAWLNCNITYFVD